MVKKDKNIVSSALLGVAVIQAIVGFLAWYIYNPALFSVTGMIISSFAFFTLLAILARIKPVIAAVTAILLYGCILLLQAIIDVRALMSGLVFKIPILLLLLIALVSALRKKQENERQRQN
jgi:hypothetical protein